jgi:hypothetical protein
MAAIQQIQNLIALSQPIPPDLQIAALLEAQQQGLSSNALAGVFGVPESMIADAVSALGLSGQLSPSFGGTLAPATKFDNNVGVVSGRTAAAQESQPIELAPPALLPEGYGSTIDRPFSGVLSLPNINTLRGNVFDEDLAYQDAKELYQDIQEGLFSGATDSPGAILKAIIDSTIASQNQAGTSSNNFPAGTWYDPDTGLEIPNFDPTTGAGMGTLFPTFVPDSDTGGGSEAAAEAAAKAAAEEALSGISAEGGFSEAEANEVYDLLEAGTVTLNDVSRILDVPQAVVTAGYEQIKAERAAPEEVVDLTADTTASTIESGKLDFEGEAKDPLADYKLNPELYTYDYVSAQLFEMIANETNAELRDGLIKEYEGLSGQAYDPNKPIQPIKKSDTQIQEEADAAEIENAARTEAAEKEAAWGNVDKDLPLDQIVQAVINIFGTGNEGVAKVIDIANQRGSTAGDIATASGISIEDVNAAAKTAGVTINTTPDDAAATNYYY